MEGPQPRVPTPHQTGDGGLNGGLLDACGGQGTRGGALRRSEQSQQEMFTSHIAMPQLGRAFPCQTQGVLRLTSQITACHNPFILSVKGVTVIPIQVFPPSYRKHDLPEQVVVYVSPVRLGTLWAGVFSSSYTSPVAFWWM